MPEPGETERPQKPPPFGACGFESHPPHSRSRDEVRLVESLAEEGFGPPEISRATGIPRSTIRYWLAGGYGRRARRREIGPRDVSSREYAYLFGLYLGDGHIARMPRTYRLDIAQDTRYPGIIHEACYAMARVLAPNKVGLRRVSYENAVAIYAYSSSLPALFPQHGPGRKHTRRIVLADWQREIGDRHPELFLRGLIHSDGCRVTNRVRRGKYAYPRYFFTQVSTDIMELCCRTCRQLGIEYTLNTPTSLSIARAGSVAYVDGFVGPKA